MAFSADGRILASGGLDGKVRLWDPANGEPVATLDAQSGGMTSVAFSPDELLLASPAVDGTVRLWDIRKRASISQLGIGVALLALGWGPCGITIGSSAGGVVQLGVIER